MAEDEVDRVQAPELVDTLQRVDVQRRSYHITLNRPAKLNAFSARMYEEVRFGLLTAEGDRRVDVVVIDAAPGRAFATGGDLEEFLAVTESPGQDVYVRFDREWRMPFEVMLRTSKPVISVVDGLSVAGGLVTCLCSDIVIASEASTFACVEGRVGLSETFSETILPLVVGLTRARYMTLTGAVIDAVTAERWGIITNLVASSEELGPMLDSILMMIQTTSPEARAAYKSGITSAVGAQNGLRTVRTARQVNGVEGLNAFRERRSPEWHVAEDGET